ncbi:DHA2 family efflux MFS transporter permease subunit [Salinisphaera sp.]|uniref:DHA2 family efflux MFS transporter permease subunit n=1 Tax=Salinisphaera sp. TaxID=1914330 RepID=UPI002D784857|nr:DHA2 family efflux MFS transporter permease subunit [Salinisphaera sp.]HET7315489.1 DHA2 family efflux MFS transporter permease subunit [Salinisphaera sp.]
MSSERDDARAGRWPVALTVLMGTIAVVLNATVINVAIPPIMADFGLSQAGAQWISTGFLAAMTAAMLASARVIERLGQRRTFEAALCVFLLACVLAAASPDAWVLIAARVIQGATAGIIQPLALVMIFQSFDDAERGRALGLYGMGVVLAPALGPTVGGFLIDWLSWRAVFLPSIPFCLLGLAGGWRVLTRRASTERVPFDWLGFGLLGAALVLVLVGLTALSEYARLRGGLLTAAGLAFAAGFVIRLLRSPHPLIRLAVFAYPRFVLTVGIAALYGAGLYASTYLVPLLAQSVQQMSPSATGLVMMPAGLTLLAIFPIGGRLADRFPAHRLNIIGCGGFALGTAGLALADPTTPFWLLAVLVAVGRMALGVMMPALNIGGLRGLPSELTHQGSSMISFARQLGGTLGVNLFALLLEIRAAHYLGGQVDLRSLYQGQAPSARALAEITRAFRDTFAVFGAVFLVGVGLAIGMAVLHRRENSGATGRAELK